MNIPLSDDILSFVIERFVPHYTWRTVETVSKQFHRAVSLAFASMKTFDVFTLLPAIYKSEKYSSECRHPSLRNILKKISKCSSLKELEGLESADSNIGPKLWKEDFNLIATHAHILTDNTLMKCHFDIGDFAAFFSWSCLRNMRYFDVFL